MSGFPFAAPPGLSQFPLSNRRKLDDSTELSFYGLQPLLGILQLAPAKSHAASHSAQQRQSRPERTCTRNRPDHAGAQPQHDGEPVLHLLLAVQRREQSCVVLACVTDRQNNSKDKEDLPVLPACYNAKKIEAPALVAKMQYMPEEVLFYIFYTMPHDAMQAHAASILSAAPAAACPELSPRQVPAGVAVSQGVQDLDHAVQRANAQDGGRRAGDLLLLRRDGVEEGALRGRVPGHP